MPKRGKKKVVLEREHITAIRAVVADCGPQAHALFEWIYTNGARASEPGMAKLDDIELEVGRVRLMHLKGGLDPEFIDMAPSCVQALKAWLPARTYHAAAQRNLLFPSASPGPCDPCDGTGRLTVKKRDKEPEIKRCHHCGGGGTRWGLSRHEVRHILDKIFERAGIHKMFRFPHVLRHSVVTHLLDRDVPPTAIQERVGHRSVGTTFGYMKTTQKARRKIMDALGED